MKKGIMVIFTVGIFYIFFLLFCGFSHNITLGNQASLIIKNDQNETFFESCYQMDVLWTELNNLPDLLVEGTVAVEDKRFYQHHGYDPIRIMKALYKNLVSQDIVEGASTITQQTIKNLYLTQEKTYSRKIKELFLSVEAELHYTKEDILETYFNTLYYGHGIYGIQNASQFYFNKNPNELTLAEIAMLIGIPNSPNNYSPYLNDEKSRNRQLIVLNVMRNQNLITDQQYTQAKQEKLMLADFKTQTQSEVYGYYKDAVLQECRELGFCSSNQDHITIYTYYDETLQKTLQNEFDRQLENTDMQAAGIIMEPYTFHIKAIQ